MGSTYGAAPPRIIKDSDGAESERTKALIYARQFGSYDCLVHDFSAREIAN